MTKYESAYIKTHQPPIEGAVYLDKDDRLVSVLGHCTLHRTNGASMLHATPVIDFTSTHRRVSPAQHH